MPRTTGTLPPRLSVQIGLRYDALPHTYERNNVVGNFNQATYLTGASAAPIWNVDGTINSASPSLFTYGGIKSYINGTNLAGVNGYPRGVVTNDYKTWQPRVGFSEDLFGNGKTILRGGFGTFYERMQGNDIFGVATSAPFDPSLSINNPYFSTPGKNMEHRQCDRADVSDLCGRGDSVAQTFRAPAVAMYSLGVQRELSRFGHLGCPVRWQPAMASEHCQQRAQQLADQHWPGEYWRLTRGRHVHNLFLQTCQDARQVAGDGTQVLASVPRSRRTLQAGMNAYRMYPGYAGIGQDENVATGNYNGLQTAVRIQNRWGLSAEVDYTYSHTIDIQSQDRNNVDNPWYIKYDKGSGAYDRRHIINANYIYNLPIFNKSEGLVKSVLGGWQIAGTFIKETGVPQQININDGGVDPVGLGGGYTNHPNKTPGVKLHYPKTAAAWFDITRIDNNVTPVWLGGTNLGFGNWGKDALVLPGRFNLTTSLYKTFQIYKTANFQLKFESFNTLNHTEFNGVDTASGALKNTQDPRNLQLGGKFNF
jgi:hypothetical protein